MEATNTLELQADTLAGDIRDRFLDILCGMDEPWTKLDQRAQQRRIDQATKLSRDMVRGGIVVVAERGLSSLETTTGKWTVKDGAIKLEVAAASSVDNITTLATHGGGAAILVLTDAGSFFGERAEALADLDQPELPISETAEGEGNETASSGEENGAGDSEQLGTVSQQALKKLAKGIKPLRRKGRGKAAAEEPAQPERPEQPAAPTIPEPVA